MTRRPTTAGDVLSRSQRLVFDAVIRAAQAKAALTPARELGETLSLSHSAVVQALRALVEGGWLTRAGRGYGETASYRVLRGSYCGLSTEAGPTRAQNLSRSLAANPVSRTRRAVAGPGFGSAIAAEVKRHRAPLRPPRPGTVFESVEDFLARGGAVTQGAPMWVAPSDAAKLREFTGAPHRGAP